ncbi:MAG: T9SS type A sorting domain-containing protein [Bacteroidota bacterium]
MKKTYLFLALILLFLSPLEAQITLTSAANVPQIGDSFDYIFSTALPADARKTGANQTWDFSQVSTSSTGNNSYVSLANSMDGTNFPNANLVETDGSGGETYYNSTASALTLEGQVAAGAARVIFSDKREFLEFPMTFNDVFNETFGGTVDNLQTMQRFDRSGTVVIQADGYGDLILPYGTIDNVLKVSAIYNYEDRFMGTPFFTYVDTITVWYDAFNSNFIANTTVTYTSGNLLLSQTTYMAQSSLVTSIDKNELGRQVSFYPSPAHDVVTLENETGRPLSIQVTEMNGRVVKDLELLAEVKEVSVQGLAPGVYFIRFSSENKSYTDKLVIH